MPSLPSRASRGLQSHVAGGPRTQWVPPEKFQRLTRKFWLQPADMTHFKLQVRQRAMLIVVTLAPVVPGLGTFGERGGVAVGWLL